jgi:type I restriction enzyme S subunit
VPQDPNDEPARDFVKRIEAVRNEKTGSKKSRAAASHKPTYEIEPPFDIPESWEWVRLGSISNYGECQTIDANKIPSKTWSLDLEEIEKGSGRLLVRRLAGEKASTSSKHKFCKGMILYSKLRTYLNKVLIADMDGVCTSEIIPITLLGDILPEYIRTVLMSPYFLAYTASKDYGVKMPRIGTGDARAALIPLPPLAEQKRIVKKIDELKEMIRSLVAL